jgi:hypothetical protein
MEKRVQSMFAEQGMVGSPLAQIRDLLQRGVDCHFFIYEEFCRQPEIEMERLYCYLGEEPFEHDFENVENTATDPDHLYLLKYPHVGDGKVEVRPPRWHEFMSLEVAQRIVNEFGWFYSKFYPLMPTSPVRSPDVPAVQRS